MHKIKMLLASKLPEKYDIRLARVACLIGGVVYPFWGWLAGEVLNPSGYDSFFVRSPFVLFFLLTYIFSKQEKYVALASRMRTIGTFLLYAQYHYICLMIPQRATLGYYLGGIITISIGSLLLSSMSSVLLFHVLVFITGLHIKHVMPGVESELYFYHLVTVSVLSFVASRYIIGVINELEERGQALLSQRNRLENITDVALKASHDIRSPLAFISSIPTLVNIADEQLKSTLDFTTKRLESICNELLNLAKTSNKESVESPELVTLKVVIENIKNLIEEKQFLITNQDIKIEFKNQIDDDSAKVNINVKSLMRILSNLINNSMESFSTLKGVVSIKLESNDKKIEISVEDNGPGISRHIIDKLGKRFISVGKKEGTGLGLFYAKSVIESWEGIITVDILYPTGTRVKIALSIED